MNNTNNMINAKNVSFNKSIKSIKSIKSSESVDTNESNQYNDSSESDECTSIKMDEEIYNTLVILQKSINNIENRLTIVTDTINDASDSLIGFDNRVKNIKNKIDEDLVISKEINTPLSDASESLTLLLEKLQNLSNKNDHTKTILGSILGSEIIVQNHLHQINSDLILSLENLCKIIFDTKVLKSLDDANNTKMSKVLSSVQNLIKSIIEIYMV
jgi:hypothetical protein